MTTTKTVLYNVANTSADIVHDDPCVTTWIGGTTITLTTPFAGPSLRLEYRNAATIRREFEWREKFLPLHNFMNGVCLAFREKRIGEDCARLVEMYGQAQRSEQARGFHGERVASELWTQAVKYKVKQLPPPGPRVYCQPDDDDL